MSLNSHMLGSQTNEIQKSAPKLCEHKAFNKRKQKDWETPQN